MLVSLPGVASAAPPATLDADIESMLAANATPGLAIAIVEDGKTVFSKGYGTRRAGTTERPDGKTLFEIGSTSKAFTAAALAILVDEGKLKWDDRVVDHMPEFQMYDPWVTREYRVKDLLVHRSGLGLGAGDLTFVPRTTHTRAEIMGALRWLKPETSFRTTFSYSNLNYVAAGQLIEKVSGQRWEDFVTARILKPTGMAGTFADGSLRFNTINRAQPHARLGPPMRGAGPISVLDEKRGLGPNTGPAGGIASSADDMARWIALQLAQGKATGSVKPLWSEAQAREMWQVATPTPTPPAVGPMAAAAPKFSGYALGWSVRDWHGERVISHSGGTLGFLTHVLLLPERNVGFVFFLNSEDGEVFQALIYNLLDHYTGQPKTDWFALTSAQKTKQLEAAKAALATISKPANPTPQSLPAAGYAGAYRDAWYGPITVRAKGEAIELEFPKTAGMVSTLEHLTGDSFVARWADPTIEPAIIRFNVQTDGKVESATMKAWSPIADFSFDYHNLDIRPVR